MRKVGALLVAMAACVSCLPAVANAPTSDPAQPPARDAIFKSIDFAGGSFDFYKQEMIANGVGLYFAPGGANPDDARQAIIVNYMNSTDAAGNAISAEGLARAMEENVKQKGGILVAPFATPDPANQGQFQYFVTFYYVYPQDRNGDVWLSKVARIDGTVVGILYKQTIDGADPAAIEANIKTWLVQNLQTYGGAVSRLATPTAPGAR